ncbi:ABC transporter permease [Arthrobacter sp. GMC3]|uniref:ABC transporter permease n=1 Tax=Arthrobacter sp. GMC3 TaxID=2058894 RepID=UPI000CE54CC1|nr:ABC transporter permease [Arthrobacter sp. GMC3]
MLSFVIRRLLAGVALVFVIATITYVLMHSSTGNVARNILGENATAEQVAAKTTELGLDQPLLTQYFSWLGNALTGNFGISWYNSESVTAALVGRMPITLSMVISAIIVIALISVVLGVTAAVKGGWLDRVIQVVSVVGFALPNFWVALMLVLTFSLSLRLLPATGYVPPSESILGWAATLLLPVTSLVLGGVASAAQQIRGATIDVLRQDYIRTLHARGLSPQSVVLKHALRNAAGPALTVLSLQFIALLGGAVVIERVFAIPGIGTLTVNAALGGDVPLLMGIVVVMAILVVLVNLVIDIANGWVNPKVRVQ